MQEKGDLREFSRVDVPVLVEISCEDGSKVVGEAYDISMNGLLMQVDLASEVGTSCSLRILIGEHEPLIVETHGEIVRKDKNGIGINFINMDLEGFSYMRNLVMYNAKNMEKVEQEFAEHLGLYRRR